MIGIICPFCKQPRKWVYPHLRWAHVHNQDLPKKSFVYLVGMEQRDFEFRLQHPYEAGDRFAGYHDFCREDH